MSGITVECIIIICTLRLSTDWVFQKAYRYIQKLRCFGIVAANFAAPSAISFLFNTCHFYNVFPTFCAMNNIMYINNNKRDLKFPLMTMNRIILLSLAYCSDFNTAINSVWKMEQHLCNHKFFIVFLIRWHNHLYTSQLVLMFATISVDLNRHYFGTYHLV